MDSNIITVALSIAASSITSLVILSYKRGGIDAATGVRLSIMESQLGRIESKIDDLPCHRVVCPTTDTFTR